MTPSGGRNPRHRPSPRSTGGWPPVPRPSDPPTLPRELVRLQLAEHPGCQWQARMVRCPRPAEVVVESRERVLRSSCEQHVPAWLRTGARPVA